MVQGKDSRLSACPRCSQPAAGDGDRCIFCGSSLQCESVRNWRVVYHSYSYADGLLATSALQSHGLVARMACQGVARALTGSAHGVVQVAHGDHLRAQEVLRQIRGVRTDTEYLEWQLIKHGRRARRGLLIGAIAALAAAASMALALLGTDVERPMVPPAQTRR